LLLSLDNCPVDNRYFTLSNCNKLYISLHVYALSLFKSSSGIISSIESLLNKFFWGGREDHKKVSWIGWHNVCLQKEFGGLEVRQLREFNYALLGKWCWRMLVDRCGFWHRVLVASYGEAGGRLEVGGQSCFSLWREVAQIRNGDSCVRGDWFGECVLKKVGDGSDTLFWFDKWLGLVPLCVRYCRLFDLYENKSITVANLFSLGVAQGGGVEVVAEIVGLGGKGVRGVYDFTA